jgi:GT2 family glycosyltransferase
MSKPLLIVPSYLANQEHIKALGICVASLRQSTDAPLLIIDDGSPMPEEDKNMVYFDAISEGYDNVSIHMKEENSGFSSTVNIGLRQALENNQDAILINADIEFKEHGWLETMVESEADIVGALLFYPSMLIQHAGIYFSIITRGFAHRFSSAPPDLPAAHVECECPVTGALQFIRHSVLEDVGVYDEDFKLGFEDVDYLIRAIKAGHKSLYNPKVKAVHHESLFRGGEKSDKIKQWEHESLVTLLKKHKGVDFTGIAPSSLEL